MNSIPKHLYHYYEAEVGPFKTFSDLSEGHSENALENLHGENGPDRYIEAQVWCNVDINNISVFKFK